MHILRTPFTSSYKYDAKVEEKRGIIVLSNCDFRQGIEISMRILTIHDIEWVFAHSTCKSDEDLKYFAKHLKLNDMFKKSEYSLIRAKSQNGYTTSSKNIKHMISTYSDGFFPISPDQQDDIDQSISDDESSLQNISWPVAVGTTVRVLLRWDKIFASVSMSGDLLFKRRYKATMKAVAPLPEHIASACFQWMLRSPLPLPLHSDHISKADNIDKSPSTITNNGTPHSIENHLLSVERIAIEHIYVVVPFAGSGR